MAVYCQDHHNPFLSTQGDYEGLYWTKWISFLWSLFLIDNHKSLVKVWKFHLPGKSFNCCEKNFTMEIIILVIKRKLGHTTKNLIVQAKTWSFKQKLDRANKNLIVQTKTWPCEQKNLILKTKNLTMLSKYVTMLSKNLICPPKSLIMLTKNLIR